jgi:CRP-like cAMP-binding protein
MLRRDGKIELLKRVPLFARCNKKQLSAIARLADVLDVPTGKTLIREGAPGGEFMVIVEGAAEVKRNGRKINTLGPGDVMGEIALVAGGPRSATVTTTQDTSFLVIGARQFWELLEQAPDLQVSVIRALGERLQSVAI